MSIETAAPAPESADLSEKYRQFIRTLPRGGDYLEVKYRLMWLREAAPDAQISTELLHFDQAHAVFKATVSIPSLMGDSPRATGHGSETKGDFTDYLEKAETKALGRALAALGFGTQFCQDFDEGVHPDGTANIVDAPVGRGSAPTPLRPPLNRPAAPAAVRNPGPVSPQSGERMATEGQLKFLYSLLSKEGLDKMQQIAYHGGENGITFTQVKAAIDTLQARAGSSEELPDWKIVSGQIILDDYNPNEERENPF